MARAAPRRKSFVDDATNPVRRVCACRPATAAGRLRLSSVATLRRSTRRTTTVYIIITIIYNVVRSLFPPCFFFSRVTCARVAGRDRFIVIRERRRRRAFDHDLCRAEVVSTLLLSCWTLSRTWTSPPSPWPPVRHVLRGFFLSPPAVFSNDTICLIFFFFFYNSLKLDEGNFFFLIRTSVYD